MAGKFSQAALGSYQSCFCAPEALQERSGSDFVGPETCVRALLASMSLVGRFSAPRMSHLGLKSRVLCQFVLVSWGLLGALFFGRFSRRLSSGIWSLHSLREQGAYGFRPVKTNRFSRFFNVREAAGRAARQATEYPKLHKPATQKKIN